METVFPFGHTPRRDLLATSPFDIGESNLDGDRAPLASLLHTGESIGGLIGTSHEHVGEGLLAATSERIIFLVPPEGSERVVMRLAEVSIRTLPTGATTVQVFFLLLLILGISPGP